MKYYEYQTVFARDDRIPRILTLHGLQGWMLCGERESNTPGFSCFVMEREISEDAFPAYLDKFYAQERENG